MIVTKMYMTKEGDLAAVIIEDGRYTNFIMTPEIVALDTEGLLEEARLGFPEAFMYDGETHSLEEIAKIQEEESTLVAEIGEDTIIYPKRMNEYIQGIFEIELGEELWNEILQKPESNQGIKI